MAGGPVLNFSQYDNNTNPKWWLDPGLRINVLHCAFLYFCVFYLGYDGSLLNGLQPMPQWTSYFNHPAGNYLGLISASFFLPAIVTPYISSWINDRWGRKASIAVGSLILILGAFINAFATNAGMFIAGRVLVGGAGPFGKITAVSLVQEIAHPRLRPILASSFYANYYFGSIAAAWFCFGSLHWSNTNTWAWRAPCLFQIMAPLVVLAALYWIPESPRWLVSKGKNDKALAILARYHANDNPEDPLVKHEMQEIRAALVLEEEGSKTKYINFFQTPGNRRRLIVLVTMATGTNWIGNSIISYYLTPVLTQVGITNPTQIAGINGGLAVWNLFWAYAGALNAERAGRRFLWIASTIGMLISYIILTALAGSYATTKHSATGLATVPFLFIYYGWYDIGWTPLPFSYGAEIMPYNMRTKGVGVLLSVQNIAQAFNQWVNPVALAAITWKYYIVYDVLIIMYLILIYFFFPETKRLTIEEVSVIFDTGRKGNAAAATAELQAHIEDQPEDGSFGGSEKEKIHHIEDRDVSRV